MKQFKLIKANGEVRGPISGYAARNIQTNPDDEATIESLGVGMYWKDPDGDTWIRLDDCLQDHVPVTETDVAECRASASRVRQSLRLERIATAVLAGLASVPNNSLQLTPDDVRRLDVESAIKYAKALIAKLDKQA